MEEEKGTASAESEAEKDRLLSLLKREVKQIMEEASCRTLIQEESNLVLALCASMERCVAHGLRRRVLGLFGNNSSFALLHKVARPCPPAAAVLKALLEAQKEHVGSKSDMGGLSGRAAEARQRYLWIRIAFSLKLLQPIVHFLHANAQTYYVETALMADPVRGIMVSSLIVGPSALELSKMKSGEQFLSEPSSTELVQRHYLASPSISLVQQPPPSPSSPRPPLSTRRNQSVGTMEEAALPSAAREYVHSMHQNTKATLLYGKNNVSVCPAESKSLMKGYLSLHQNGNGTLSVKWTPNELMHTESLPANSTPNDRSTLWKSALHIAVEDIVYLHFHQRGQTGGSIVLVGADGVQQPTIHFPSGQHPLAFLSCLETGLLPWGQLDPPLWLQRGKGKVLPKLRRRSTVSSNGSFKERKTSNGRLGLSKESIEEEEEETAEDDPNLTHDYVFRVVPLSRGGAFTEGILDSHSSVGSHMSAAGAANGGPNSGLVSSRLVALSSLSHKLKDRFLSLSSSPTSSPPPTPKSGGSVDAKDEESPAKVGEAHEAVKKRYSEPVFTLAEREAAPPVHMLLGAPDEDLTDKTIQSACDSMRHQIISRAFYGWLAHCRHLKTIREHLSCLVEHGIIDGDGADEGLTAEKWAQLREQANVGGSAAAESELELHRIAYFGGIADMELRRAVWPYLTAFVPWTEAIDDVYATTKLQFEEQMTAWMAVEAIVRQRDKEQFAAARAWREKGATSTTLQAENDVFEESAAEDLTPRNAPAEGETDGAAASSDSDDEPHSGHSTPEEGEGGIYTKELIDTMALNLHRIEKDVQRCDRHHPYFVPTDNLDKLKRLITNFVWVNLETGYIQGMCDIAAPLLVVFDDEVLAYGCFCKLMERMSLNFPHAGGMDTHLANMRSLIQVMDPELFDLMRQNGDYTHFYFCYRWFLLDFKRELAYGDVLRAWEVTWGARRVASSNFILFLALAFLLMYRPIILDNNMDFTDIIKFYNEMAEKHDANAALSLARSQVRRLQLLIRDHIHNSPASLV